MNEQATKELKNQELGQKHQTGGNWSVGVILVAVGGVILFNQIGIFDFGRWWALFLLVPVLYFGQQLVGILRQEGRLTAEGRRALIGLATTLVIPVIILFNLSWQMLWPLMLVLGGVSMLLTRDQ